MSHVESPTAQQSPGAAAEALRGEEQQVRRRLGLLDLLTVDDRRLRRQPERGNGGADLLGAAGRRDDPGDAQLVEVAQKVD